MCHGDRISREFRQRAEVGCIGDAQANLGIIYDPIEQACCDLRGGSFCFNNGHWRRLSQAKQIASRCAHEPASRVYVPLPFSMFARRRHQCSIRCDLDSRIITANRQPMTARERIAYRVSLRSLADATSMQSRRWSKGRNTWAGSPELPWRAPDLQPEPADRHSAEA